MRFHVEQVGEVSREDVGREQVRVLAVRCDYHGPDRWMIRWHRAADEQGSFSPGRYGGIGY
jgi:hypothetical protein